MTIAIDVSEILVDRGRAAYKVMHEAGKHGDKHGQMEGLLVMLIATAFTARQFAISPRKLQASLADVYQMIIKAQKFCGEQAGIAEVVTEMGLN